MDKTTQRRPYPRGGRMAVESVAECPWNGWPNVHGIGGRITVESVAECDRNTQPLAELQEFLQHTPSHHRRHPTGLLGLYAAQLANHSALKKAIRQNPRLVDYMTLVDATTCPIHDDMRRLGVDDGGPLDRLHQEYHRAIAVMDALLISSPANDDWSAVERAEKALEQAIIEAFWKSKAEDGNPPSSG